MRTNNSAEVHARPLPPFVHFWAVSGTAAVLFGIGAARHLVLTSSPWMETTVNWHSALGAIYIYAAGIATLIGVRYAAATRGRVASFAMALAILLHLAGNAARTACGTYTLFGCDAVAATMLALDARLGFTLRRIR